MADLAITAANVIKGSGAVVLRGEAAGETVTAGQAVYKKSTDGRWYKAQADGTAEESGASTAQGFGLALNGAAAGQSLEVQTSGFIAIGSTPVVGGVYVVSAAAGSVCPLADLITGNYVSVVGVGYTGATQLLMAANPTGIVHA